MQFPYSSPEASPSVGLPAFCGPGGSQKLSKTSPDRYRALKERLSGEVRGELSVREGVTSWKGNEKALRFFPSSWGEESQVVLYGRHTQMMRPRRYDTGFTRISTRGQRRSRCRNCPNECTRPGSAVFRGSFIRI